MAHVKSNSIAALASLSLSTMSIEANASATEVPGVYETQCAACHGPALQGTGFGPSLTDGKFHARWDTAAPGELQTFIERTMPPASPGSLTAEDLSALVAFISRGNDWADFKAAAPTTADSKLVKPVQPSEHDPFERWQIHGPPDTAFLKSMASRQALIAHVTSVTDSKLQHPTADDWPMWRRATDTLGYSPLSQINRRNVRNLTVAWSLSLTPGANAIAPLVHDGVMFLNATGRIMALDGRNGDLLWEYVGNAGIRKRIPLSQPRSIALYGNSVFVPTLDGHLLALDIHTGKVLWDHSIFQPTESFELTAGPIAVRGKVIQGVSGCEARYNAGGCFIVALDASTGNELWRFRTIALTGQPGGDSWNGANDADRYGASVWSPASYDADLNLVYFGTGQSYDISTLLRPNPHTGNSSDALYTDCTLALDADTGHLVWYYQHLARDIWDLDWAFEQSLLSVHSPTGPRKVVFTGGKIGVFDALDARTGQFLFSLDMGLQNLVLAVNSHTGVKTINPDAYVKPDHEAHICPFVGGVRNWPSTAFDPKSGLMFIPMVESCMDMSVSFDTPENQAHWSLTKRPDSDGKYGRLAAVDVGRQRIVWTNRYRAATSSAALATAGELVFEGTRDRYFRALDAHSGAELWSARLDNTPNAFPISFAADHNQYVAIVAGGGTAQDIVFSGLTPEIPNATGARTIWVFRLPP